MRAWSLVLVLLAAGCAEHEVLDEAFGPSNQTLRERIETFPPEQREAFALMQRRCTRCHTLNVPLSSRFSAGVWSGEVRKMVRKPGSAIPEDDGNRIAAFMEYLEQQRRVDRERQKAE
jgi:hypothetical protein